MRPSAAPGVRRPVALLVHGLTDAPYSMRTIGEDLRARGYHVVALRVPGHGTVPAGLIHITWEDWLAAVRVGAAWLPGRPAPAPAGPARTSPVS